MPIYKVLMRYRGPDKVTDFRVSFFEASDEQGALVKWVEQEFGHRIEENLEASKKWLVVLPATFEETIQYKRGEMKNDIPSMG